MIKLSQLKQSTLNWTHFKESLQLIYVSALIY